MKQFLQMKRSLRTVLLVLLLSVVGMGKMSAQEFTAGDLNYSVNDDGVSVTVTGLVDGTAATGSLLIPESVTYQGTAYAVTAISDFAFYGCSGFTGDLVIPNSVTSIGEAAFMSCDGFTGSLTLSSSLTTIQDYTFYGCKFTGSLTIPTAVTMIGTNAFTHCTGFTGDLILPNALTSIGYCAFYGCIGFNQLSIPDAVTAIGSGAFAQCWFYGELNLSRNVERIGEEAFEYCPFSAINVDSQNTHYKSQNGVLFTHRMDTLMQYPRGKYETSYIIPNSVTRISAGAFIDCFNLISITIPNSVVSIGGAAFSGTYAFRVIDNVMYIGEWCLGPYDAEISTLNIEEGTRGIADWAFTDCLNLTGTLNIPNSVMFIGSNAFASSSFTGPLVIPNSVETIGNAAFRYCNFTGPLVIPNSVETIGNEAFFFCDDFSGEIVLGNSVTSIGKWAFVNCSGVNGSLTIPSSTISIGEAPFWGCDGIEHIAVDWGNTVYDSRNDCNAIIETATNTLINGCKSTVIPNSVTTIGNYAFCECQGLTGSLIIPNSVVEIGHYAFGYCKGLTGSLVLPNALVLIGDDAFEGCEGLMGTLILPNSLEQTGKLSFWGCNFNTVVSLSTTPPIIPSEDYSPFGSLFGYPILVVCCGSKEAYEASDWLNCVSAIEEDCSPHNVIIDEASMNGGNVGASASSANMGEEVRLTITPNAGMVLASLVVSNANDSSQTISVYPINSGSTYGFIMPPFDVVVCARFVVGNAVSEDYNIEASVYPNPTTRLIKVEAEGIQHITISNMLGQVVYDGNASGNLFEYDFGKHNAGLYFIRIETANGVTEKKVTVR